MESACRQWGARRFRKLLRVKGLGARGKVGTGGTRRRTIKRSTRYDEEMEKA